MESWYRNKQWGKTNKKIQDLCVSAWSNDQYPLSIFTMILERITIIAGCL